MHVFQAVDHLQTFCCKRSLSGEYSEFDIQIAWLITSMTQHCLHPLTEPLLITIILPEMKNVVMLCDSVVLSFRLEIYFLCTFGQRRLC